MKEQQKTEKNVRSDREHAKYLIENWQRLQGKIEDVLHEGLSHPDMDLSTITIADVTPVFNDNYFKRFSQVNLDLRYHPQDVTVPNRYLTLMQVWDEELVHNYDPRSVLASKLIAEKLGNDSSFTAHVDWDGNVRVSLRKFREEYVYPLGAPLAEASTGMGKGLVVMIEGFPDGLDGDELLAELNKRKLPETYKGHEIEYRSMPEVYFQNEQEGRKGAGLRWDAEGFTPPDIQRTDGSYDPQNP